MKTNNCEYRFYHGDVGDMDEQFICRCHPDDMMGEPIIGDMVYLPLDVEELDQELYIIKQRIVYDDCIEYFCKMYNWED